MFVPPVPIFTFYYDDVHGDACDARTSGCGNWATKHDPHILRDRGPACPIAPVRHPDSAPSAGRHLSGEVESSTDHLRDRRRGREAVRGEVSDPTFTTIRAVRCVVSMEAYPGYKAQKGVIWCVCTCQARCCIPSVIYQCDIETRVRDGEEGESQEEISQLRPSQVCVSADGYSGRDDHIARRLPFGIGEPEIW